MGKAELTNRHGLDIFRSIAEPSLVALVNCPSSKLTRNLEVAANHGVRTNYARHAKTHSHLRSKSWYMISQSGKKRVCEIALNESVARKMRLTPYSFRILFASFIKSCSP